MTVGLMAGEGVRDIQYWALQRAREEPRNKLGTTEGRVGCDGHTRDRIGQGRV